MALSSAFQNVGKSFTISVAAANQVTPVNLADLGLQGLPQALQFINNGPADVWVVMSAANNPVAAFPTAGTITTGTPQPGFRLKPGAIVVYEANASTVAQNVPNAAGTNQGPGFYLAMIGSAAGPTLVDVTPGEGV
jgi:hypothetical protein